MAQTTFDLQTALALAEDMQRRGKRPSDLNPKGQALLAQLSEHLRQQGYASYQEYAARQRPAASAATPSLAERAAGAITGAVEKVERAPERAIAGLGGAKDYPELYRKAGIPEALAGEWSPLTMVARLATSPIAWATGGIGAALRTARPAATGVQAVIRKGVAGPAQTLAPREAALAAQPATVPAPIEAPPTRFPAPPAGRVTTPVPSGTVPFKGEKLGEEAAEIIARTRRVTPVAEAVQRRGVVSDEMVDQFAKEVGIRRNELLRLQPGTALSAEHIHSARTILKESAEQVHAAAQNFLSTRTAEARGAFEDLFRRHAQVQIRVAGLASESGRSLRQFRRILQDLPPITDESLASLPRNIERAAQQIIQAGREGSANTLGQLRQATWGDMLAEFGAAAKVSGPLTQLRNTLGNTSATLWRPIERVVTGAVEAVRAGVTRTPRERFVGEAAADIFGKAASLKDAGRKFVEALRTGMMGTRAQEVGRVGAIPGKAGEVIRAPFRWMTATDEFFREINRRGALYADAYRQAARAGQRGQAFIDHMVKSLGAPSAAVTQRTEKEAAEYLFQMELSESMRGLLKLRNQSTMARLLFPFFKTPVNLVKFVFERSPAGVLSPRFRAGLLAGGGEASETVARVVAGSLLAAGVVQRATEGQITGAGPKSRKQRDLLYAQGWQPYSIKVGGKWLSYRGFDPMSTFLSNAANYVEIQRSDADAVQKAFELAQQAGRGIKDSTWLQGAGDILNALDDPGRYGAELVAQFAGGFVPRILSPVTLGLDPYQREVPRGEGFVQQVVGGVQRQIPGASRELPARTDVFGKPIQRGGGVTRGLYPSVSTPREVPVASELQRLDVGIPQPSRTRRAEGKVYVVPESELRRVRVERGEAVRDAVGRLIRASWYQRLSDEEKRVELERVMHDIARRIQPNEKALTPKTPASRNP